MNLADNRREMIREFLAREYASLWVQLNEETQNYTVQLAFQLREGMGEKGIPGYMRDVVERYILVGCAPGGFLGAVFSNDLAEAFSRADETNSDAIRNYVRFLFNHAPAGCWGSAQNFKSWLSQRGFMGIYVTALQRTANV